MAVNGSKNDVGPDGKSLMAGKADMGNAYAVGGCQQRMVDGQRRLFFENIESGACQSTRTKCISHSVDVRHIAAGGVD